LIRHGQTDWNREGRLQGQSDIRLNSIGSNQAKELAAWMMAETNLFAANNTLIYSSPLQRAMQTASILGEILRLKVFTHSALKEISFGSVEGKTYKEVEEMYGKEHWEKWHDRHMCYPDHSHPGGESAIQGFKRFESGLLDILNQRPEDKDILIVSHGSIMNKFLGPFKPDLPHLDNCCCVTIAIPEGSAINFKNCTYNKIF
jgi:probable phosphoglycerate mutase